MDKRIKEFITIPFVTPAPALQAEVSIPLTVLFIILYGAIFVVVYIQLIAILYYRHKRFSYQTAFLFQSLIWSMLRITLFSFYFKNAEDANKLEFLLYFLLYCFPVILQFTTLCLLVLYYGQVYFKIATRQNQKKNRLILRTVIFASILLFITSSVFSAYYTRVLCSFKNIQQRKCHTYRVTVTRIAVTDSLFLIFGCLLSFYLFRLAKLSLQNSIPEQNNISVYKAMLVTICTSFLLLTRTLYNILAITLVTLKLPDFGFDWINVSDQADLVNLTETKKYVTFTVVLLIWELIPTFVIVLLFRLKKSYWQISNRSSDWTIQSSISVRKSVFLDYSTNNQRNSISRFEDSIDSNLEYDFNNADSYNNNNNINYNGIIYHEPIANESDYENNLLIKSNNNNSFFNNNNYGSI